MGEGGPPSVVLSSSGRSYFMQAVARLKPHVGWYE
jgi:hypothetical protein